MTKKFSYLRRIQNFNSKFQTQIRSKAKTNSKKFSSKNSYGMNRVAGSGAWTDQFHHQQQNYGFDAGYGFGGGYGGAAYGQRGGQGQGGAYGAGRF